MAPFSWSRWLRSLFRPRVAPLRRPPRGNRPAVEALENRVTPSVYTWTGDGPDANWSDKYNWLVNNQVGVPNPNGGDDLVFPAFAHQQSTFNDLLNSSGGTAAFDSLKFSDNADGKPYTLAGNPIIVGDTAETLSTSIVVNTDVSASDIQLDVTLAGPGPNSQALTHDITVGSGSVLTIDGHLSGSGGQLDKEGLGTLVLTNDNSGQTGTAAPLSDPITVDVNGGILQITNPNALGDASPTNVVTVQTNGQLQINNVGNVGGPVEQTLILNGPGPIADGALLNVQGINHWAGSVQLDSDTTIGSTRGNLFIDGVIGDNGNGHNLTKVGDGEITFTNANTYRGVTTIDNGILDIQNPLALGAADDTAATGTVVNQNVPANQAGTLQIDDPNAATDGGGFTVANELLTLNGLGGPDQQNVTVNGNSGSFTLTILGSPTVALPFNATTSRVQTALDNALNNIGDFPFDFVTVTSTPQGSSTVYTVEFLGDLTDFDQPQMTVTFGGGTTASVTTLRHGDAGALNNLNGDNTWTGDVIVGSPSPNNQPATIGVTTATTLTITGHVQSTNGTEGALKDQPGTLILTADNAGVPGHAAFIGGWTVQGGILQIQDSRAAGSSPKSTVTVEDGASFALAIDDLPDSVTGTTNTLLVSNPLTLTGFGASVLGALVNISGINTYAGTIALVPNGNTGDVASIGVLPDPNPSPNTAYITDDYHLSITGAISGDATLTWFKYGDGQLILPNTNPALFSDADIVQGWVTAQASGLDRRGNDVTSLGGTRLQGMLPNTGSIYTPAPPLDQNLQATVTVEPGAALHLDPTNGGNLSMLQNLVLKGPGIAHTFGLINDQGALENLDGYNTWYGDVSLEGAAGIGVEQVFGPSQLVMTGSFSDQALVENVAARSPGGNAESDNVFDTGGTSGTISLTYNMYGLPGSINIYYGIKGQGGISLYPSSGAVVPVTGTGTINLNYSPTVGASFTTIDVVIDQGGSPLLNTQWDFLASFTPNIPVAGGITKVGSKLLALQGDGTYGGPVDVRQGVLLDQNDTGLGSGIGTTTVEAGAALALANGEDTNGAAPNANGIAYNNGGIQTGIEVWGETLILNGPGNTTLGQPLAALDVLSDGSLTIPPGESVPTDAIIATDDMWRGPITLNTSSSISVAANSRLILSGAIDDASNPLPAGSDLLKVGDGEVIVVGSNSYRGTTYIGSGPQGNGDAPTAEIQQIEVFGGSQGTFTLSVANGGLTYSSNPLPYGDTPADVQTQLTALLAAAGFPAGTVAVAQTGSFYYLTMGGALAGQVPVITVTASLPTLAFDDTTLPELSVGGVASTYYNGVTGEPVDGGVLTAANSLALGATSGGTIVQPGSSLQTEGNITIAGEPLTIAGQGIPATPGPAPTPAPATWFNEGPAPNVDGPTLGANAPVSGRVTGITVDPTDPNTIYLATAGGGAWKTSNGGKTWQPMFDQDMTDGDPPIFIGAVALDANNPLHVFLGTGEADNSTDSYGGTGVYQSFDGGVTWSLMTGETSYNQPATAITNTSGTVIGVNRPAATFKQGVNPFAGLAISSIVTGNDPNTGQLCVFLAASDQVANSASDNQGNSGVWRWTDPTAGGEGWFCLTDVTSDVRLGNTTGLTNPGGFPTTPPDDAGPDDDYNLAFPTIGASDISPNTGVWSQVQLVFDNNADNGIATGTDNFYLWAALANPISNNTDNAVYHCTNPFPSQFGGGEPFLDPQTTYPAEPVNVPLWYVGNENTNPLNNDYSAGGSKPYPNVPETSPNRLFPGNIKFWGAVETASPFVTTLFAATADIDPPPLPVPFLVDPLGEQQVLLDIWEGTQTTGQGYQWVQITSPPTNYMGSQGLYDNAVYYDGTTAFFGGENAVYETANAGGTWTNVSIDTLGNGPAADIQVFYPGTTTTGDSELLTGTDGGLWGLDTSTGTPTSGRWFNYNGNNLPTGNLSISLANSVSIVPSNPSIAYVSTQAAGTDLFTNSQGWTAADFMGDDSTGALTVAAYGAAVAVDPNNPSTIFAWVDTAQMAPEGLYPVNLNPIATLRMSTDGGVTWTNVEIPAVQNTDADVAPLEPPDAWGGITNEYLPTVPNTNIVDGLTDNPVLLIDPVNSNRILIGGHADNSIDGDNVLYESIDDGATGTWVDLNSAGLQALGFNAFDTVSAIAVASYQGPFLLDPGFKQVADIGINSYDPNTIYVSDGTNLAVTKNHGTTWLLRTPSGIGKISDIEVDPNDRDVVYVTSASPAGSGANRVMMSTNAGRTWVTLNGAGTTALPDVPIWKLQLDPRSGYLYVGTDQGVYYSTDGGSTWGVFGLGLPDVQVKDMVLDQAMNTLTIATYGRGSFIIYLNETTANAGALNSVGGTGVWGGPVSLSGPTSIGATGIQAPQVGSLAAQLNITGIVSDLTPGANNYLTKVGLGDVILSGNNTYGGTTEVQQGALIVDNPNALGATGVSEVQTLDLSGLSTGSTFTLTFDGVTTPMPITLTGVDATDAGNIASALNALSSVTGEGGVISVVPSGTPSVFTVTFGGNMTGFEQAPLLAVLVTGSGTPNVTEVTAGAGGTIVDPGEELGLQASLAGEPIELFGNGITFDGHAEGACSLSNANTFTGTAILESNTTIGVDSGSVLTVASPGSITDNGNGFNLVKELTGTLVLDSADSYGGAGTFSVPNDPGASFAAGTVVAQGALDVENAQALGDDDNTTTVLVGAQVQLQGGVTVANQNLRLSGTGINLTGALEGVGGANHWMGPIVLAEDPGFNPVTLKPTSVGVGALLNTPGDNLYIDGVISQAAGLTMGLTKYDAGIVTLTGANTFGGPGNVAAGSLRIENAGALGVGGTLASGTTVQSGAALELDLDPNDNAVTVPTEWLTLNGVGTPEVQVITVSGTAGAFFLGFNGQISKTALPYNATASQVQVALNGLSTIGGATGGSVSVARTPLAGGGFTYTVLFGGKLAGSDLPQITASSTAGTSASVTTFRNGGSGALRDLAGSNTWAGPVLLQTNSSIGADPGATLTVSGNVQDVTPATVPAPMLTKIGAGTVVLPGANSYTGPTSVAQGILNIQNDNALGGLVTEVQTVALNGSLTGSFNLTFNGATTPYLSANTSSTNPTFLATVTTALNNLASIGGVGGSVTLAFVAGNHNSFTVTFDSAAGGHALANQHLPVMTAAYKNGATASVSITIDGSYGTTVTPGGTLQMQGTITVSTESLTLSGTGTSAVQQFSTSGAPFTLTFNGQTATLPANATQDQVAAALDALSSIGGAGGSVTVSQVSGVNVTPIPATGTTTSQQVNVVGSADLGFTLTVNGQTTAVLPYGATAAQVQSALANLSSIGTGDVTVTGSNNSYNVVFAGANQPALSGSGVYDVVFGGSFANQPVPALTGSGFGPTVNVTADGIDPTAQDVAVVGAPGGGFTLTFNGQTTQPILFGATAAQVQTALDALTGIGGANSSVTVTLTGGVYVVSFNGSLAGTVLPLMTGSGQVITTTIGGAGALDSAAGVNTWSATNPVTNPFLFAGNTWLGSEIDYSTVTPTPSILNIAQAIATQAGAGTTNVTKVDFGTVQFSGTTANTYNGNTTVADGLLQLNKTAGVNAIPGAVQVGDNNPTPPNFLSDVLQLLASNQMPMNTTVTVLPDGLFDLNGYQQTIGALNMTSGTVSITGPTAQLTLNGNVTAASDSFGDPATIQDLGTLALGATARTFNIAGPNSLYADLIVSAPVSGSGGIIKTGTGTLAFTADNPNLTGLTNITRGEVLADGDPAGGSTPGTSQTLAAVSLNGGTLGGNGSVGPVTATATGGTLMGGDGLPIPPSILNIDTTPTTPIATLDANTKFNVVLYGPGDGPDSQVTVTALDATGNLNAAYAGPVINLGGVRNTSGGVTGGAVLTGILDPAINIGQSFTILTTNNLNWTIAGYFAEQTGDPGVVFINGEKFTIGYEDVNGNPINTPSNPTNTVNQVVLTRTLDTAVVTVSSSSNPSVYGQGVTFTATVTPEPGTGVLPTSDTVTFQLDNNPVTETVNLSNSRATFAPLTFFGQPLSVGPHTITATFNADGHDLSFVTTDFGTFNQTVQQASVGITVSSSPANPIPGQTVTVTASVAALPPGAGIPTNQVQFYLDGAAVGSPVTLNNGVASTPLPFLTASLHRVRVSYLGDTNFKPTTTTTDYLINVVKGTPTVAIAGTSTPTPPVFGQTVTLTATLSGPITPTGTVTFYNGAITQADILGSGTLVAGLVSITVPEPLGGGGSTPPLSVGTHTINVLYSGDTSFLSVTTAPPAPTGGSVVPGQLSYTIDPASTQTTLTLSSPTIGYGQVLSFTASVAAVAPGAGTPTNTVTFYDGNPATTGTPIGNPAMLHNGTAVLTNNTLSVGAHTIYAMYNGDGNFATSTSTGVPETVMVASTVTVTTTPSAAVFGQAVTLTAAVAALAPATGHPTAPDTITFYDGNPTAGGTLLGSGPITLNSSGQAVLPGVTSLSVATHTIYAVFSGDAIYLPQTGTGTLTVSPANTTTTVTAPASSTYGQGIALSATIGIVAPGAGTLTGSVTFYDGLPANKVVLGTSGLTGNVANISNVTALGAGTHTIYAVYGNDPDFAASTGTATVKVNADHTTTSLSESSSGSAAGSAYYSVPVTLAATVTANFTGNPVPTGSVTFTDNGKSLGAAGVNAGGIATLTVSTFSIGSHNLVATYGTTTNFLTSASTNVPLAVAADHTNTVVTSSVNPSYVGQAVTFTATVTAAISNAVVASGSVSFYDGTKLLGSGTLSASGKATFATSALAFDHPASPHTINATYGTTTNFLTSSGSVSQTVLYNSSIAVTSSTAAAVYGQTVTFTATISTKTAGASGLFGGTVTFFDAGKQLGAPVSVNGSGSSIAATLSTNSLATPLSVGSHSITATYTAGSTSDFIGVGPSAALSQKVGQDATTTVITAPTGTAASPYQTVYGLALTFTATVTANAPGSGTPTGTVNFYDGGKLLGSGTLGANDQATFSDSTLSAGVTHAITAKYAGDTNFTASPASTAVSVAVAQAQTDTVLTATTGTPPLAATTTVYGQAVTFTATVTATTGAGAPVGMVFFSDVSTGTTLGGVALTASGPNSATATLVVSNLAVGNHNIAATFGNTTNYAGSSTAPNNNYALTVTRDATTTTVTSSANPSFVNQAVVFTAVVAAAAPGSGTPTGTVAFYLDGGTTPFATVGLNSKGVAVTPALASLTAGAHQITAVYNPGSDPHFLGSDNTASPLNQLVKAQTLAKVVGPGTINNVPVNSFITFQVTGLDASGNQDYSANGPVKVTIQSSSLNAGTIVGAGGQSVALTYNFSNGIATISLKVTKAGTYVLLIDAGNGITTTVTLNTVGRQT